MLRLKVLRCQKPAKVCHKGEGLEKFVWMSPEWDKKPCEVKIEVREQIENSFWNLSFKHPIFPQNPAVNPKVLKNCKQKQIKNDTWVWKLSEIEINCSTFMDKFGLVWVISIEQW